MNDFLKSVFQLCKGTNVIAGVALTVMMGITVTDVILRTFGKPIPGAFELVALTGAVVAGFAVPFTSWGRGHIYVDVLIQKLPAPLRKTVNLVTRCLGTALFGMTGYNLLIMGRDLHRSGEVSPTMQIPFYPVVYAIGICCFVECLVLVGDIVKIARGEYE